MRVLIVLTVLTGCIQTAYLQNCRNITVCDVGPAATDEYGYVGSPASSGSMTGSKREKGHQRESTSLASFKFEIRQTFAAQQETMQLLLQRLTSLKQLVEVVDGRVSKLRQQNYDSNKDMTTQPETQTTASTTEEISTQAETTTSTSTVETTPQPIGPMSCNNLTNGTHTLRSGLEVLCHNGWIVFQKRESNSISFAQYWSQYRNGFGDLSADFWLGLEHVYRLTKDYECKLRVDFLDSRNNRHKFAEYSIFYIDDERANYTLHIGGYSGTAGDKLSQSYYNRGHNNKPFTTRDVDNDFNPTGNCARENGNNGGWWYRYCYSVSLNANIGNLWWGSARVKSPKMMLQCDFDFPRPDPGWYSPNNHYQYKLTSKEATWDQSKVECQNMGGMLASHGMKNYTTLKKIAGALLRSYKYDKIWIGLNDNANEGTFVWEDGTISTRDNTPWMRRPRQQPDNSDDIENCVEIVKRYDYRLNDNVCIRKRFALCEKPLSLN